MKNKIEDYALIGNCETSALVSKAGSIEWFCAPRFDSPACFAALLGSPENGHWHLSPADDIKSVGRSYAGDTLVLETVFECSEGSVKIIDFMPMRSKTPSIVRIVKGISGRVKMKMDLTVRFDYGHIAPWVKRVPFGLSATAGPDALRLKTPARIKNRREHTTSDFTIGAGETIPFTLAWYPSHDVPPRQRNAEIMLAETEKWWKAWSSKCSYGGKWRDAVMRSAITLKALTYEPTGGIVAAPTTSLPENIGGSRNWDYRFCWLRDATFTLHALMLSGYIEEAEAWHDWLLRAVAGVPSQSQIMYGVNGERQLREFQIDWLSGYEQSKPVRIGNQAYSQFQLDVFGEVMDTFHLARESGFGLSSHAWFVQVAMMKYVQSAWKNEDEGIWEVRGPRRHFTHSKIMAWVAFDRAIKSAEKFGLEGPVGNWRKTRDEIHAEVCEKGFSSKIKSFVQYYGSNEVDASLLMIPLVGFLPPKDERVIGTVERIQEELMHKGFLRRYKRDVRVDGIPEDEGVFLVCTLWLADNLALQGKHQEACDLFERVLSVRNDLGLLSEEYDPALQRLIGNFPQAWSHVGVINTARNLSAGGGPAEERAKALPSQD